MRSSLAFTPLTLLKMTNEQLGQLYEFMQATKELYQPVNSKNDKS